MIPAAQARNTTQRAHLAANQHRLVIDADTHVTDVRALTGALRQKYQHAPNYYHGRPISAEDLLAEMAMARVDMALIWQNPAATPYGDDPETNFEALLAANRYVHEVSCAHPLKFIPGGWTDPKALGVDLAIRLVDVLVQDFGFPFVKMNPAQNRYPIHSQPVRAVLDRIVQLGAIPAFHFGADTPFTPASGLRQVAEWHPGHPVLAIHMGGGGAGYVECDDLCQQARELGLEKTNIRYALSAKRDTHIESDLITYQLAGDPFRTHLFCASDAPYGRLTWNFGGYREMFRSLMEGAHHTDLRVRQNPHLFDLEAVQGYLGGNFARFTLAGYENLIPG